MQTALPEKSTYNNTIEQIDTLLSQGDTLMAKGELWKGEQAYAEALKIADREKDKTIQRICFQKLGEVYVQKKAYTQATALYNTALRLANTEPQQRMLISKIKQAEKLFLEAVLKHPVSSELITSPELDAIHRASLISIRQKAKQEIARINQELNPYLKEDYDPHHPEIKKLEIDRATAIQQLYQEISENRKQFIQTLLQECIEVLGEAPCRYAAIALGSLARQETTPYSDFEWALLIEEEKEEYKAYFRNLTQLLHLKVINLGETILPSMCIESLNPAYPKQPGDNWFYDAITPRGFAFDGHMPKACKTPLGTIVASGLKEGERDGNGKKVYELIRTPKRMAELQQEEWYQEDLLLPHGMRTCRLIAGDESLVSSYKALVTKELQETAPTSSMRIHQVRAMELLSRDLSSYYLNINNVEEAGKLYDVKKEIYRLPDRIIDGLALYYLLDSAGSWERIKELCEEGYITKEARDNLNIVMSIATELRLSTYLAADKQGETLKGTAILFEKSDGKIELSSTKIKEAFQIPSQTLLVRFYYTALPLQKLLAESLSKGLFTTFSLKDHYFLDTADASKGKIYARLLQYRLAKQYFEEALKQSPENPDILVSLGTMHSLLGDDKAAKGYLKKALEFPKVESYNLAVIYNNLGMAYAKLGKHQKGIGFLQETLRIKEKLFGWQHPFVVNTLNNLGSIYGELGAHQKKIELLRDALGIQEKLCGRQHPSVAGMLNNLGIAYGKLGEPQKKIKLLQEALGMQETLFGRHHPSVAGTLNSLGNAYGELGAHQKKIELLQEALGIKEKLFGRDHPEVANTLNNLGVTYGELGEYQKAIDLLQEALRIQEKIFGRDHHDVADTLNNLGTLYGDLGEHQKEIEFLQEALRIQEKLFGREHPEVAGTLNNLGSAYGELGAYQKEIELLEEALGIKKKLFGQDHLSVANTLNNLGNAYGALGAHQKAIELLEEALRIQEKRFGRYHPSVAGTLNNLGNAYGALGAHQKEIELLEEALGIKKKLFGQNHPSVAATLNNLGNAYGALGEHQKETELLQEALRIQEKVFGQHHPSVALTLSNLGTVSERLGNVSKALNYMERAYGIYANTLGTNHVKTNSVREVFKRLCVITGNHHFLNHEIEFAKTCYQKLGLNIMDPTLHASLAVGAYQQNTHSQMRKHLQILTILTPSDVGNWHTLGVCHHSEARMALEKNKKEEAQLALQEAKQCFIQGIKLNENSAILTDYANFLLMNDQAKEAKNYLTQAVTLKGDGKDLSYRKMERLTVNQELQKEIDSHGEITNKAYLFAYYQLITHHQELGISKIELEKYLGEFKEEVAKESSGLSHRLLGYGYKSLKRYHQAKECFSKALENTPDSLLCQEYVKLCQLSQLSPDL